MLVKRTFGRVVYGKVGIKISAELCDDFQGGPLGEGIKAQFVHPVVQELVLGTQKSDPA
jgi:hypothetical protein